MGIGNNVQLSGQLKLALGRMRMAKLQEFLQTSVDAGAAPFLVAMAGNSQGSIMSGAAGEAAPGRKATEDTVFRIFSMTKAIGSAAAMILADRGKLDVDAPVETYLPQFADLQVLDGFAGDQPRLRKPKTKATARHLATHTSGLAYEIWHADIAKWLGASGHPSILSGLKSSLHYAMACDPGTEYQYGIGIDWLGQLVEAVDGRTIDRFCRDEMFDPLDMKDTQFECLERFTDRLASVRARDEAGAFVEADMAPPPNPEFYGMGHALYSTMPDYAQFLRMLLNKGTLDGKRILSPEAVEKFMANSTGSIPIQTLPTGIPNLTGDLVILPDTKKSHSLGFVRTEEDTPGRRRAASQGWAGVLNTHFWFDPAADRFGLIMTQTMPFLDPAFVGVYDDFERMVYRA